MNYENGFAREEFLQYMFEEFPSVFNNAFSRKMLENIVDYGIKNHSVSKNSLYYYLKDMIPEAELDDLIPYIDKSFLTDEVFCFVVQNQEPIEKAPTNNHLGEFDIPAIMGSLANNAWYGKEPTKMCLWAGDDVITLEGYTYEPGYEYFSSTSSISFNGECLYGIDSRNVDAYKNEVYDIGRYKTLDEAISYIKEQIKDKEPISLSEPKKLDKKINSATARSKESISKPSSEKADIVLE